MKKYQKIDLIKDGDGRVCGFTILALRIIDIKDNRHKPSPFD
jgi:hypothetical protein